MHALISASSTTLGTFYQLRTHLGGGAINIAITHYLHYGGGGGGPDSMRKCIYVIMEGFLSILNNLWVVSEFARHTGILTTPLKKTCRGERSQIYSLQPLKNVGQCEYI